MNKRKILESAQKHLQRGALDKALEDYQTLLKADAKDSNIRLKVGDLHLKLGRSQDAIDAYLRVAQQFTNEGFDAKAVALYKQITKLDEKRFDVHAQLGDLYQRMGLTSEAMRAMQSAADCAHRAGDKGQALALLRRMAALDPSNTANRLKVADLLRTSGQIDDALAEYDEVVRELGRQNNGEEQVKVLERALEFAPGRPETLRALARAAIELGDTQRAERTARALLEKLPDDVEAIELAGTALERAGRSEDAAEVFRGLAEKFRARGDEDRARALMQRYGAGEAFGELDSEPPVLESDPTDMTIDPELDASLGLVDPSDEVALESGDEAEAEPDSAPPVELEPAEEEVDAPSADSSGEVDPDADFDQLLAEASVFLRYGKHERAVETLRAALRVEPGNPLALEKLGEALAVMGNRAHASSALARAGAAYADAGDAEGVERVRGLLRPIDAKAAAALAPVAERAPQASAAAESAASEIDVEIDAGLDDETIEPVDAVPPPASDDDFSGIEIDVSSDLASDEPAPNAEAEEPELPTDEPELTFESGDDAADDTDEALAPAAPAAAPTPSVAAAPAPEPELEPEPGAQLEADYEEGEFYREQGMRDEARALYARVLAAAPDHAMAKQRLAELDAAPDPELGDEAALEGEAAESEELALDPNEPSEPVAPPAPPAAKAAAPKPTSPVAAPKRPPAPAAPPPVAASVELPAGPDELELGGADFDLAAELSGAFGESSAAGSAGASADGDGFAEVFAAFKAGVRREVGEGDTEAHYDLGIAYKEMGLHEDAIGEFRVAMADAARRLACLHLMGVCALELGRGPDAVAHLSEALASGALPREQEAALRVDLGRAYQASGDRTRARAAYEAARALVPDFGDVERLLAELDAAPAESVGAEGEAFESFDDLIADDPRSALAEKPAAPQYESFDELISEDADLEPAAPREAAAAAPEPDAAEPEAEITLTEVAMEPLEPEPAPPAAAPAPEAPRKPAAEPAGPAKGAPAPAAAARRKKKISFV